MMNRRFPLQIVWTLAVCGAIAVGSSGCGGKEEPAAAQVQAAPTTSPGDMPEPATPAANPSAQPGASGSSQSPEPPATPAPEAQSPAPSPAAPAPGSPPPAPIAAPPLAASPAAAPASGGSGVADPGGEIAVTATKSGLTRIGAQKCKMCHLVQYASWAGSAHAKRTPALDCESCHGAGSEYSGMAVMKDPAKATAAGLVKPDAAFCQTCHKQGWSDERLKKAHAHKAT